MPRRKLEERNIRKLVKTSGGRSFSVTIPVEIVRRLKWRERQNLVVEYIGNGKIQIRDRRKK